MNQSDLIERIAEGADVSKAEVTKVLTAFERAVTDALLAGESAHIAGFLKFSTSERAARVGRNPSTGESIQIPAKTGVNVSAGSRLKKAIA